MLILGIETSTPVCSVALSDGSGVMAQYTLASDMHHSERLVPMVQQVLADAGVTLGDLHGVAVASGPGSFTGLRIGMGLAKGLCMAAGLPLLPVPTLAGMALGAGCEGLPVCPMLDARRGEVYAGVYDCVDGRVVSRLPDRAGPVSDWFADLPRPVVLVGDGAWLHRAQMLEALSGGAHFASRALGRPDAGAIALLGADMLVRGDMGDVDAVEPVYLRRSQAELVREARLHGGTRHG